MAFQLSVTKVVPFQSTPLVYPNAYWVPVFKSLDKVKQIAVVSFQAYADKATRDTGTALPVASHDFRVSGTAFNTYFGTSALSSSNLYSQAYLMAKNTADPIPPAAPKNSTAVVFFANATEV